MDTLREKRQQLQPSLDAIDRVDESVRKLEAVEALVDAGRVGFLPGVGDVREDAAPKGWQWSNPRPLVRPEAGSMSEQSLGRRQAG